MPELSSDDTAGIVDGGAGGSGSIAGKGPRPGAGHGRDRTVGGELADSIIELIRDEQVAGAVEGDEEGVIDQRRRARPGIPVPAGRAGAGHRRDGVCPRSLGLANRSQEHQCDQDQTARYRSIQRFTPPTMASAQIRAQMIDGPHGPRVSLDSGRALTAIGPNSALLPVLNESALEVNAGGCRRVGWGEAERLVRAGRRPRPKTSSSG